MAETASELVGAALGDWLTAKLGDVVEGCDGLFTATGTAGAAESVSFWSEVAERGPRFANPRTFPWTLASAPAGHIAMSFDVRGPVVNFIGSSEAAAAALESALDHLDDGFIQRAAVVAFDRSGGLTTCVALVVELEDATRFVASAAPGKSGDSAVAHLEEAHRAARERKPRPRSRLPKPTRSSAPARPGKI